MRKEKWLQLIIVSISVSVLFALVYSRLAVHSSNDSLSQGTVALSEKQYDYIKLEIYRIRELNIQTLQDVELADIDSLRKALLDTRLAMEWHIVCRLLAMQSFEIEVNFLSIKEYLERNDLTGVQPPNLENYVAIQKIATIPSLGIIKRAEATEYLCSLASARGARNMLRNWKLDELRQNDIVYPSKELVARIRGLAAEGLALSDAPYAVSTLDNLYADMQRQWDINPALIGDDLLVGGVARELFVTTDHVLDALAKRDMRREMGLIKFLAFEHSNKKLYFDMILSKRKKYEIESMTRVVNVSGQTSS